MKQFIAILSDNDEALFERMSREYKTENERVFFEKVCYKQKYVTTFANDLLLSARNNEDGLYMVRILNDEYEIGQCLNGVYSEELHTMDLSEALSANLKELGYLERDITLLEWLQEHDYEGIEYEHNFDEI